MRRLMSLLMAVLMVGSVACGGSGSTAPTVSIEETTFAPSLNVNLATMTKASTGYYYQDLIPSSNGDFVRLGDSLDVNFNGYLTDGKAFALSNPLSFRIGVGAVMTGWDQGLIAAPIGGRRRLIIPPALGYGDRNIVDGVTHQVVVPKNSILLYDITVIRAVGR